MPPSDSKTKSKGRKKSKRKKTPSELQATVTQRKHVWVRATQLGYYNLFRRRPGDVFRLECEACFPGGSRFNPDAEGCICDTQFSGKRILKDGLHFEGWMEDVTDEALQVEKITTPQMAIDQTNQISGQLFEAAGAKRKHSKSQKQAQQWEGLSGVSVPEEKLNQLPRGSYGDQQIRDFLSKIITVKFWNLKPNDARRAEIEWTTKQNIVSRDIVRGIVSGALHPLGIDFGDARALEDAIYRVLHGRTTDRCTRFRSEEAREWIGTFSGKALEHGLWGFPVLTLRELAHFALHRKDPFGYVPDQTLITMEELIKAERLQDEAEKDLPESEKTLPEAEKLKRKADELLLFVREEQITACYSPSEGHSSDIDGFLFKPAIALTEVADLFGVEFDEKDQQAARRLDPVQHKTDQPDQESKADTETEQETEKEEVELLKQRVQDGKPEPPALNERMEQEVGDSLDEDLFQVPNLKVFEQKGDKWQVTYIDKTAYFSDIIGFRYLIFLLERPTQYFPCTTIERFTEDGPIAPEETYLSKMNSERMEKDERLEIRSDLKRGPAFEQVTDLTALREYRKRLKENQLELARIDHR